VIGCRNIFELFLKTYLTRRAIISVTISNPPSPGVTGTFFLPRDY